MKYKDYENVKEKDKYIINEINKRGSKPGREGILEHSTFKEDMDGVDAKGYIKTFTKGNLPVLVQIKNISFNKLPPIQQIVYLEKVSANMTKIDPNADQRLICYIGTKNNKVGGLYNYNIKKRLEQLY